MSTGDPAAAAPSPPAPPPPPVIDSPAAARAALRWGFERAIADGARTLTAVAPVFDDWPLDDPALLAALTGWLKLPRRRLVLLAAGYDTLPRAAPRFVAWRRHWAHAIEPRQAQDEDALSLPTWLLDDRRWVVEILDPEQGRGRVSDDRAVRHRCGERVDALLQRSSPAFAVYTVGL